MKKKFQDTISRVKFPVESKSELRLGVENKRKPGNRTETSIFGTGPYKKKKI